MPHIRCYALLNINIMKTKYFKACEGWGTGSLDSVINKWLDDKEIEIIKMEYSSHYEKKKDHYGFEHDAPCQTALLIYRETN